MKFVFAFLLWALFSTTAVGAPLNREQKREVYLLLGMTDEYNGHQIGQPSRFYANQQLAETIYLRHAESLRVAYRLSLKELLAVLSVKVHDQFDKAEIVGDDRDHTPLGVIELSDDLHSIFNESGTYGSDSSITSIWNHSCRFGEKLSDYSAFNPTASHAPLIKKNGKIIGRLSTKKAEVDVVDPFWIRSFYK